MLPFDITRLTQALTAAAIDSSRWTEALEMEASCTGSFGAILFPVAGAGAWLRYIIKRGGCLPADLLDQDHRQSAYELRPFLASDATEGNDTTLLQATVHGWALQKP